MNELINTEQLSEWSGCKQKQKLMMWLNDNHIPYRLNRDGYPITTSAAVNASLMQKESDEVDF